PIRLSQHLPNIPAELESVVVRMLAKDRDARYQSEIEALNDLKRAKACCEPSADSGAGVPFEPLSMGFNPSSSNKAIEASAPTQPLTDYGATYETNIAPQSELNTPPQTGFETNANPAPGEISGQTTRQLQSSGAPAAAIPQTQRSRLRRLLPPALAALTILIAVALASLYFIRRSTKI